MSQYRSVQPAAWEDPSAPCYFIAEIGVNHNGDVDLARRLIDVAADAGADAVKFQTFHAEQIATRTVRKANYQVVNDGGADTQLQMLKRLELLGDRLVACRDHCVARGIRFLSTPFGEEAADLLESMGVDGYKVSSGDLTHLPFLRHLAAKGLPIIISTGMADLSEVEDAVNAIEEAGNPALAILHCVSNYPANVAESNLRAMDTLAQAFGRAVGWSDHTEGDEISLAAVARGARIIEKHFTLDRSLPGPDHAASLEPGELAQMIARIRRVESALGDGRKRPQPSERDTAAVARRSIVSAHDIREGQAISMADVTFKRPGTGLPTRLLPLVLGRVAARDIPADTVIAIEDLR
jgi:N-acetylneuraminate synthase